jgi:hypothetical protein
MFSGQKSHAQVPSGCRRLLFIHSGRAGPVQRLGRRIVSAVLLRDPLDCRLRYVGVAAGNGIDAYFGFAAPWWSYSLTVVAPVAILGYRDIELSSKFLGVPLVAESLAVAVFDAAIFLQPPVEGIGVEAFLPSVALDGAPRIGLVFAFFGFFGLEATAHPARRRHRSGVTRSTAATLAGVGSQPLSSATARAAQGTRCQPHRTQGNWPRTHRSGRRRPLHRP